MLTRIGLLVLALLLLLGAAACDECDSDGDCRAATCCHAKSCVPAEDAPDCQGVACTLECQAGTMDCGGYCYCKAGECRAELAGSE